MNHETITTGFHLLFILPKSSFGRGKDTNASIRKKKRRVIECVCIFCKPILQIFYKDTNASIRKTQRIVMSSHHMRLYYCKPILQILYKDSNAFL